MNSVQSCMPRIENGYQMLKVKLELDESGFDSGMSNGFYFCCNRYRGSESCLVISFVCLILHLMYFLSLSIST